MKLKIKKLDENATIPTRAHESDAGLDLYSIEENVTINPQSRLTIKTGISIEIPEGYYGRVAPKSGLASKQGIDVLAGVIDSSYRGEVKVILYNTNKDVGAWQVFKGDKIAQLIIEKHYNFPVEIVKELSDTERGDGGFGSTGV
jgi:dUTP pyrophosphatase